MPILTNPRHEVFCQNFAKYRLQGLTQGQAYSRCGFNAKTDRAAEVMASRLLKRPDIQARMAEIAAPAAKKAGLTAEVLLDELQQLKDTAAKAGQFAPAVRASELRGKLSGHLIERSEIKATVTLEELRDVDGLVRACLAECTIEEARALFAELLDGMERVAAEQAQDVTPEPAVTERVDEAAASIAALGIADTMPTRNRRGR